MIKKLIRKVKLSKKVYKLFGYGHLSTERQGYNNAVKDILKILEPYKIYDELIDKVSPWWDEVYPAEYPDIIQAEIGDEGAIKVAEIRELLYKVKMLSERGRSS